MKLFTLFSPILILALSSSSFADPKFILIQKALRKKQKALSGQYYESGNASDAGEPTGEFDQRLDHFNPSNTTTFKQRYFVDGSFAKSKDAPVIYYICGEGTCEGATGTPLVDSIAKKYHAYRVALEHRYYGYSQPFATLEARNLKYLSMEQALEDLADFQKYLRDTQGMTGKWISIGGSYPGSLSAFYRLKHPELVVGALASSAPVLSKANFEEYDHHVAKVAGAECLAAVQTVVKKVEGELQDPASAAKVKELFNSSAVRDNVDFLYVLADMAAIAVQYGYQTSFCNALKAGVASGDPVSAYAEIGNKLLTAFGITPVQDSFQGAESIDPADYLGWAGMRSWMYQSCTEWGFYQTAYHVPAESSRSSQITLQYHNDVCKRLFGITQQVNTDATNTNFFKPLFDSGTKNIFFTNGSNDPWSNLSLTPANTQSGANPGLQFFVIDGAAHCDDLGSRMSAALSQARSQFDTLVNQWLK